MSNIRLQIRRDTASNWANTEAHLLAGEIGFEVDTGKVKIGTTEEHDILWTECEYIDAFSDVWKDILPRKDDTISIGSPTNRFKELHAINAFVYDTFHIGTTPLISKYLEDILITGDLGENLRIQTTNGDLKVAATGNDADINILTTGVNSDIWMVSDNSNVYIQAPLGQILIDGNTFISQSLTIEHNLEVRGHGLFTGNSFIVKASDVKFGASIIELNAFEEGNGISNAQSGLKINRGHGNPPYLILFNTYNNKLQIGLEDAVNPLGNVATEEWTDVFVEGLITPQALLAKIKTVDGKGSGLDADFLEGYPVGSDGISYVPVVNENGHLILGGLSTENAETYHRLYVNGGIRCTGDLLLENTDKVFLRFREYPVGIASPNLFGMMSEKLGIQFQEFTVAAPAGTLGTCISMGVKNNGDDSLINQIFNIGMNGRVSIGGVFDDGSSRLQIDGNVLIRNPGDSRIKFQDTSTVVLPFTQRVEFKTGAIVYTGNEVVPSGEVAAGLSLIGSSFNTTPANLYGGINISPNNNVTIGSKSWESQSKFQVNGLSVFNGDVRTRGIIYAIGPSTTGHPEGGDRGARIQIGNDSFISDINKLHYIGITNDVAATEFGSLQLLNLDSSGTINFGATTRQMINLWSTSYGIGIQDSTWYARTGGSFSFHKSGAHSNTANDPGPSGPTDIPGVSGPLELVRFDRYGIHIGPTTIGLGGVGWYNSYGPTGWKHGTYGGGWHMYDTTYIRSFGDKAVMLERSSWDGITGNLFLKSNAPSIVMYDTDQGAKWLLHCNQDAFSVWRTVTMTNESANDWERKMNLDVSGRPFFAALVGTGARALYADPSGVLTVSSSDIRMKKDIEPLAYGLPEVLRMNPVSYNWIDSEEKGEQREIGLIAQDIQEIIPEVIGTNVDEMLSLDYAKLVSVLVNAIKAQNKRIDDLESRLDTKRSRKPKN